ncbi:MAG TPA: YceI family protein, partial [Candidatus Acidoferrum sp.]|nr:YceI family protein [Candidatus Acidoferrum sp.]
VIDATTITTGLGVRDSQLKGPGFLDVKRYPEIRFTSLAIEPITDGYRIDGDLEIKGFARLVQLESQIEGPVEGPEGGRRVRFQASTEFDWREWGLHGQWFVSPELRIEIDVTALAPVGSTPRPTGTRYTARPA